MKKLLFAFATLPFVACGNKVAPPEPAEEENLSANAVWAFGDTQKT